MSRSHTPLRRRDLIAGFALLLVAAGDGRAATLTVDSVADASDAAPGDGVCATNAAACTLRAAVQEANALSGADRIALPAGTYVLDGMGGDLDVDDDLELEGAGAATTTIDADGRDRALHVDGAEVAIRALTVRNGSPPEPTACGGGILNLGGTLHLADVVVTGSRGYRGGGVCNDQGVLEIERTTVSGNTADGRSGGGIAVVGFQFGSPALAILDSTITGNSSAESGGGLSVETFFTSATVAIHGTTISDNTAVLFGGGVYGDSGVTTFSIDESTVSDNDAQIGGGIATFLLTIATSTVAGNTASSDGGGLTGGVMMANTTVSGNRAGRDGGGFHTGYGRAIHQLRNVTVTANTADGDADGRGDGGGLLSIPGRTTELANTIVAGNADGGGETPDCAGIVTSAGHNLIERAELCTLVGALGSDILGLAPGLAPLASDGGPTATHALLPGSPATDAGHPGAPESGPGTCAALDQRGVARPYGDACDVGAVEDAYPLASCGDGILDPGEQCDDDNVRDGDCCDHTCTLDLPGALCTDGNTCTDDACDGAGGCLASPNAAPCEDGAFCTDGDTCAGGTCSPGLPRDCADPHACTIDTCSETLVRCVHTPGDDALCDDGDVCTTDRCTAIGCSSLPASGAPCDDGDVCTLDDVCAAGVCAGGSEVLCEGCLSCDPLAGCVLAQPRTDCRVPAAAGKSQLLLRDGPGDADKLGWQWRGVSDSFFGLPDEATYDLCVYDGQGGTAVLVLQARPAQGLCGDKPCWKLSTSGLTYKNRAATPDGLTSAKLRAAPSAVPQARIQVKGKGPNLPPFALPLAQDPAVVVQLRSSAGMCWEATYDTAKRNDAGQFKARSE